MGPAALALAIFGWGFAAGSYHIFPHQLLSLAKRAVSGGVPAEQPYRGNPSALVGADVDRALATRATIAMVGDSITAAGRWQELFPGIDMINRGISGDVIEGVLQRAPTILSAEPKKIFLLIGINDVAARNTKFSIDGVHLSGAGFLALRDILSPYMRDAAQGAA